jgi:hypothetical protein
MKSHLALDGLARTVIYEVSAVQVGPAVLAAGDLADREAGALHSYVKRRIEQTMAALRYFATASVALVNNHH